MNEFAKANFYHDNEKMVDFRLMSKDEFLLCYSYLTEEEYDNTAALDRENRIWRGIIEQYVPDDNTDIILDEKDGVYIMAMRCKDVYPELRLYVSDSYKGLMYESGLISGLCHDRKYLEDMFTKDEADAIRKALEG